MTDSDSDNPFQPPQHPHSVVVRNDDVRPPHPLAMLVVVISAMFAAAVTFFCTCLGVIAFDMRTPEEVWVTICFGSALMAYVVFARVGVILANRLRRTNMVLSWLSILGSALIGIITFVLCTWLSGPLMALALSTAAATAVLWKLHQLLARKNAAQQRPGTPEPPLSDTGQ